MTTYPGARNPNWKGGRTVTAHGYVLIKKPEHPRADCRGYVYEHILVAEEKLGRPLLPSEEPHHKNLDRADNRPENIEITFSKAAHHYLHRSPGASHRRMELDENELIECLCGCGEWLDRFDSSGRIRQYLSGHNPQGAPTMDAILQALASGPSTRSAIAAHTGLTPHIVGSCLSKLKRQSLIRQSGDHSWELVKEAAAL